MEFFYRISYEVYICWDVSLVLLMSCIICLQASVSTMCFSKQMIVFCSVIRYETLQFVSCNYIFFSFVFKKISEKTQYTIYLYSKLFVLLLLLFVYHLIAINPFLRQNTSISKIEKDWTTQDFSNKFVFKKKNLFSLLSFKKLNFLGAILACLISIK